MLPIPEPQVDPPAEFEAFPRTLSATQPNAEPAPKFPAPQPQEASPPVFDASPKMLNARHPAPMPAPG